MLRFLRPTKKRAFAVVIVVLCIGLGVGGFLLVKNRHAKQEADKTKEIKASIVKGASGPVASDEYVTSVSAYIAQLDDGKEKAQQYMALGSAYSIRRDYAKSLEAYKSAKALEGTANLTQAEKSTIDTQISMLTYRIDNAGKPITGSSDNVNSDYKEPAQ